MPRIVTLESTTSELFVNDLTTVVPQGTMILRHYRVDYEANSLTAPDYRTLNISIGNVVGQNFVIDNNSGKNYFRLGLDLTVVSGTLCSTVRDCHIPFTMQGDLPLQFHFSVRDDSFAIMNSDLKYIMLQFEVV